MENKIFQHLKSTSEVWDIKYAHNPQCVQLPEHGSDTPKHKQQNNVLFTNTLIKSFDLQPTVSYILYQSNRGFRISTDTDSDQPLRRHMSTNSQPVEQQEEKFRSGIQYSSSLNVLCCEICCIATNHKIQNKQLCIVLSDVLYLLFEQLSCSLHGFVRS